MDPSDPGHEAENPPQQPLPIPNEKISPHPEVARLQEKQLQDEMEIIKTLPPNLSIVVYRAFTHYHNEYLAAIKNNMIPQLLNWIKNEDPLIKRLDSIANQQNQTPVLAGNPTQPLSSTPLPSTESLPQINPPEFSVTPPQQLHQTHLEDEKLEPFIQNKTAEVPEAFKAAFPNGLSDNKFDNQNS